jgi:thiol-disulfide isomerase/thioredoxin
MTRSAPHDDKPDRTPHGVPDSSGNSSRNSPEKTPETPPETPPETSSKKRRRWRRWLIEIAVFVGVLLAVRAYMAPAIPTDFADAPLPAITFPTLSNATTGPGTITLGSNPRPTALVFWATWCGVCHVELPWINELAKTHRIITVAMQSGSADAVRQYLNKNQLDHLTVVNDPDGQIAKQFGVSVTPTLFFIAPNGRIAMAETGITSPWGIRLRLWWLGL